MMRSQILSVLINWLWPNKISFLSNFRWYTCLHLLFINEVRSFQKLLTIPQSKNKCSMWKKNNVIFGICAARNLRKDNFILNNCRFWQTFQNLVFLTPKMVKFCSQISQKCIMWQPWKFTQLVFDAMQRTYRERFFISVLFSFLLNFEILNIYWPNSIFLTSKMATFCSQISQKCIKWQSWNFTHLVFDAMQRTHRVWFFYLH